MRCVGNCSVVLDIVYRDTHKSQRKAAGHFEKLCKTHGSERMCVRDFEGAHVGEHVGECPSQLTPAFA